MIARSTLLVAFLVNCLAGCGPTAEAVTTPTPAASFRSSPNVPATIPPPSEPTVPTTSGEPSQPAASPSRPPSSPAERTPIPLSTPTPLLTPTPLSTPTPYSGPAWIPLTDFPTNDAFEVTSVTATADGFVAVGFKALAGEGFFGRRQGIVWRSADGRSWESDEDPAFQFVTLEAVAALGDAEFAFGTLETCDVTSPDACVEPADAGWGIWRSAGAGPWERLPTPDSMRAGTMDGVTTANGTLVGFGWTGDEVQSAIVWRSTDGVSWTETTDVAGMDPIDVMAQAPAGLAAFGTFFSDEIGDLQLLAAVSVDGAGFVPASAPALAATTIQGIAAGPAGVVAVGDGDDLDIGFTGVALHSADGLAWNFGQASDGTFAGTTLRAVHALPEGYVALGLRPSDTDGTAAGSWVSSDGHTWRSFAQLGGSVGLIAASASGPAGVIVFTATAEGFDDEPGTSTIGAWFAPTEAFTAI